MKLRTVLAGGFVAALVFGIITFPGGAPTGWFTGEDDGSRDITLIALSSNDTLVVTANVTSSHQGVVLNLNDFATGGNSWDYTFTVEATEHVRVTLDARINRTEPGERADVQCRIEDNGDRVDRDRSALSPRRSVAIAGCSYVS